MYRRKRWYTLFLLAIILATPGCESLGPDPSKKFNLPTNLVVDKKLTDDTRPLQTEALAAEPVRPPEYYPGRPLLDNFNDTTGTPGAGIKNPQREGKYTFNFDDTDLSEVVKTILEDTLKINYLISPKVTAKVTLRTTHPLAEDEVIPTLEMLLRMNGAVLIRDKEMYRIEPDATAVIDAPGVQLGTSGKSLPPGYQLRIVPLRYVGVQEMQKVLEPLMPPKSVVRADEMRNLLMLAGTADEMESALETIRIFDVDFMRGKSVGIFPLKSVEPQIVAEEIDKILGDTTKGPLAGLIRIMAIERLNAVLAVTTQPRYLDEVQTWIDRLDRYTTHRAGGIHVYRVQNVDALELAETLSNIFGGSGSSGGRGRPSLSPGSQGSVLGGGGGGSGGSVFGGSTSSSDMGSGNSSFGYSGNTGSTSSTMGGFGNSANQSTGLGGNSGRGSSLGGGRSGGSGGISGGSGSFGGGIGRGSSGQRGRGSAAADLGNVRIVADPSNNALIITAREQDYKEIEAVIKELDVLPLQVLIDATIAEVILTDNLRYGIKWYFQHGSNAEGLYGKNIISGATKDSPMNQMGQLAEGLAASSPYAFHYSLIASGKDIRLLLSAEAQRNKVNVLSSPSLMVLNNQEASMKVGDQVPILTGQYGNLNNTTGGAVNPAYTSFNSVNYRDTGVILSVRPRVNAGGLVIMDIEQSVDNVKEQSSGGITSPTITQRQIRSSVVVADGDTLVLGGLIRENTGNDRVGIPLLHELPLIGDLFGQTSKTLERTELVVLLTPRVLENRVKARDVTNEFRRKLTGLYEEPKKGQPIILH